MFAFSTGVYTPGKIVEPRAKTIAFHICVLNPDVTASIHRVLEYVPGKPELGFFTIETTATRTSLEIPDGHGWSVHQRSTAAGLLRLPKSDRPRSG